MPWHIERRDDQFCVIKDDDGDNEGCHDSEEEARAQMRALYANERNSGPEIATFDAPLSKFEFHAATGGGTMQGYATAFNYPIPGDYGETIFVRPGSVNYTLQHKRDQIQVLYHHGQDPQIGAKPLGVPAVLRVDKYGLWTETPLAKTSYNRDIVIPLLESGAVRSMSIQFSATQQSWSEDRSERYIDQMSLVEFGPTPFPRNLGASAALHSRSIGEFVRITEMHWDGNAAMRACDSAADFRQIAFERNNDSDPDTAAHWTLPHHPRPGAGPDSQGVAAALAALGGARGGAPDLKQSVESVRGHLQRHQGEASSFDGSESTVDVDRLTWSRQASKQLESYDADLERQAERLRRL